MAVFNADGTRQEPPKKDEQDVWTKSKTNPRVEINQHGIYRTVDFTPVPAPIPPVKTTESLPQVDDYYGYGEWEV